MYRVSYRQRATEPWQHEEFTTRTAAYARKAQLRRRLWAAVVQTQDVMGRWMDA